MTGHFNFLTGNMSSLDIALTLVRRSGRLSALAPRLAPLLLVFRPAANRDRPSPNQDRPGTNRDRPATNRDRPLNRSNIHQIKD